MEKKTGSNSKTGVVLSGGGANGAYEAGALRALFAGESPGTGRRPLEADIFTGTSVGSFNAAFLVSRMAEGHGSAQVAEQLESVWLDRIAEPPDGCNNGAFRLRADFLDYLKPKCILKSPLRPFREFAEDSVFFAREAALRGAQILSGEGSLRDRAFEFLDLASAFSTTPLHDLVTEVVNAKALLSPGAKALRVVATNWDYGKTLVFSNSEIDRTPNEDSPYKVGPLTEENAHLAVLASCAIPMIFPPAKIASEGGESFYFVDGGVLMNTPLSPAIRAGAGEIHIVYFDPKLEKLPDNYKPNTLDTLNRFLFVAVSNLVNADIDNVAKINYQAAIAEQIDPLVQYLESDESVRGRVLADSKLTDASRRARDFVEKLAHRKQVTLHRYFPSKSLGGVLGLLNFKRDRMVHLTELGYRDALEHDCAHNGCVLPE